MYRCCWASPHLSILGNHGGGRSFHFIESVSIDVSLQIWRVSGHIGTLFACIVRRARIQYHKASNAMAVGPISKNIIDGLCECQGFKQKIINHDRLLFCRWAPASLTGGTQDGRQRRRGCRRPDLCPKLEQQGSTDRPQHSRAQTITSSTTSPSTVLSEPVLWFSGLFSAKEVSDDLWIGLLEDTAIMIAFLSIREIWRRLYSHRVPGDQSHSHSNVKLHISG